MVDKKDDKTTEKSAEINKETEKPVEVNKDTEKSAVTKTDEKAVAKPTKKGMPKVLKVLIMALGAVVAFGVLLAVIFFMASSGATKASDEFLNALQSGDGTTAYNLFSSGAKEIVPEDEFVVAVDQIGPILDTEERKISTNVSAESDSNTEATVVYEIDGTDGETYIFAIEMVKEDGDWKVQSFDSDIKDEE